jgi:uncharacterized paraquat-inducible protein A
LNLFHDIPVLRRRYFWFAIAPGSILLAGSLVLYIASSDTARLLGAAAVFIFVVAWCAWYWRRLRASARSTLVQTRGLACTGCGYSLVGMDENGECPECGCSYYADHLTRCWSQAAGFP